MPEANRREAPSPAPRSRQSQDLDRLVGSALSLLLRQGIRATTLAEVVANSGLSEATVLHLVGTHDGLVFKVLEDVETDTIEPIVSAVAKAPGTADAKMTAFIEGFTKATPGRVSRIAFLVQAAAEYGAGGGQIANRTHRVFGHLYRTVEGVIQFGWLRGSFRTDLPARELGATLVGSLTGIVMEMRRLGTELDRAQIDRSVRLLLLRGIEDRIALERVLSGFVIPGYHP